MSSDEMKQAAGRAAVDRYLQSGMYVGLGTGSTAIWSIRRIGELLRAGTLTGILGVPTSFQSMMAGEEEGIPLRSLNDPEIDGKLDIVFDGADEVDEHRHLTKGGGGALLREKILATAAKQLIIVIDEGKRVTHLSTRHPIPVEVIPDGRRFVTHELERLGAQIEIRMAERKMGPVVTDNGNILLDIRFEPGMDAPGMEAAIKGIPGVVENGLFTRLNPTVLVGREDGTMETLG